MTTVYIRSLSLAVAAILTLGVAAAQDKPTGLLNNLEVRQLAARAEPTDNARLAVHFSALAERYAAEAKRHVAMSQSFGGNPSRNLGMGMSAHCKRLADLNTQEEKAVRELVAYHEKLATGAPAIQPPGGARFQAGAGAREPSAKELNALAAKASAPAEHRALEEYFATTAKRYSADADEHVALAQAYRGTRIAQAAVIHDRLAGLARESAKEATTAAAMHKDLAAVAR